VAADLNEAAAQSEQELSGHRMVLVNGLSALSDAFGAAVTRSAVRNALRGATAGVMERSTEDEMAMNADTDRRRWLALYVLCAGVLMIVLDATIVNVALPSIQEDMNFSQASLAWVVNAYLIAFGGLLLLAGRIGDLIGHRRIFLVGLAVFTAASLLCAVAQSQEVLIAARFIQGAGGAFASAVTLGMIVTMFPEPREQAKAIGVYGFVASAGGTIGLLVGGVLTDLISWHWIFFVNIPIGIATALLARRLVEDQPGIGLREGADIPGAVLVTSGLMLGVYTIFQVNEEGWTSAQTLGLGALALALITGFVVRQGRIANPLMPLRLFQSRNVSGANLVLGLTVVGMFGMFFLGALYLQLVLGYDPLEVGFAFLPATLIMGTLSLGLTDKINMRFGPRRVVIATLVFLVAGLLLFARAPVDGSYFTDIFPVMILLGLGAGLSFPALIMLAMSGADPSDAGLASGLINTTAQVGGAIGLAVLATLASSRTDTLLAEGESNAAALTSGYHLALLIGAACVASAIVVGLVFLRDTSPAEADAPRHEAPGAQQVAPDAA
jgi:EmrB/QacA subfamily drug resistance transporter